MPHIPNRRDLRASLFAAAATLLLTLLNGPEAQLQAPRATHDQALQGLIAADQALTEGAWLLDQPAAEVRLSFAPGHDRLVWKVDGGDAQVLLDAQTGEALEFVFE